MSCNLVHGLVDDKRCCCNCKYHHVDYHHCCTTGKKADGACVCSNQRGWICSGTGRMHSGWTEHGLCEEHDYSI
jgi:hypothetical protein